LARLIRANGYRKTRFHNARGEAMSARAWLDVPGCFIRRLGGHATSSRPWMNPGAIRWLEKTVDDDWSVLELGSGSSTEWFCRRASRVVAFEDDPAWAAEVRGRIDRVGIRNCELHEIGIADLVAAIESFPPRSFDLVVVDSNESAGLTRLDFLSAAKEAVRDGGHLLLDDSDNPPYWSADAQFSGWQVVRFTGLKPFPLMAAETSVYTRSDIG
jgi:SAM-dependent methyltransferase